MKPSRVSIALIVVSLFLAPILFAQAAASESQSAASLAPAASAAEVPRLIKFSGTLLDAHEHPVVGPVGVTFALYSQQSGGATLWLETQNVKPDEIGNYTVLLGANSANGLPSELFVSGEARWLGIQVGQQPEHERILLVSVPYALKAGDAETLGGLPASAFVTTATAGNSANSAGGAATSSSLTPTHTQSSATKATSTPQPAAACTGVTSDGSATVNSITLFTTACNVQSSLMTQASINGFPGINLAGNNAGLLLSGTGTHQVQVTGTASSGRLGQDATGFFFASDTNGKVIKFLTNNGTLNEWMRITSAGNVGVGTTTPGQKFSVAGVVQSTAGGFMFPDTTVQTTAVPAASSVRAITYLAGCDSCSLLSNADSQNTIFVDLIGGMTINSVTCFSDAGAPAVNIQVNHGGTLSNVLSSNLTCSTTGATSSSFATSALSLNDILNFTLVADGVAKRVTTIIKATVN